MVYRSGRPFGRNKTQANIHRISYGGGKWEERKHVERCGGMEGLRSWEKTVHCGVVGVWGGAGCND